MLLDAQSSVAFEPVVTEPRIKVVSLRRPNGHERRHAAPELIAVNPPVPEIDVTDYESLVEMLRQRADSLEISRSTIDRLAKYPDGYSGKVLSPTGARVLGKQNLGPLLDALCIRLVPVIDHEAFARNHPKMIRRDDAHFRSARQGHDGKPGKKFRQISGTVTARLFGWPAR
jgi:hypothetical protein